MKLGAVLPAATTLLLYNILTDLQDSFTGTFCGKFEIT